MEANKLDEAGAATSEIRQYDSSIIAGFQMATQAGPLCEEPMHGVCFIIEEWKYLDEDDVPSVKDIHISEFTKEHTDNSSLSSSSHVEHTTSVKSSTDEAANAGEKRERRRKKDVFGPMSGQLMSVVKDGCRKAFQTMPQRLMVAMYRCTIQATTDVLGELAEEHLLISLFTEPYITHVCAQAHKCKNLLMHTLHLALPLGHSGPE